MKKKNLLLAMAVCITMAIILSIAVNTWALTFAWDAGADWTDETKVVLIVTEPDGTDYRLPAVSANRCTQDVEDLYFRYGQEYKIRAVAYDKKGESESSNTVTYKHRDGPSVLELPVMVPMKKPDTLILQLNFGGAQ